MNYSYRKIRYQIRTNVCKTIHVNAINVVSTPMAPIDVKICYNARAVTPQTMMELSALVQF